MLTIREAMLVLDERKRNVMGPDPDPSEGVLLQYAASPDQDRAILSGYDVDHDELVDCLDEWTDFFYQLSRVYGLETVLKAALADAFQIGLIKGADSRA